MQLKATCAVILFALLHSTTGCSHPTLRNSAPVDTAAVPYMGPRVVSRPPDGVAEYYVDVKPEFDHVAYAGIIAARVGGKVGYIYQNFHAFTIHSISDSAAEKIRQMPEVISVKKGQTFTLD